MESEKMIKKLTRTEAVSLDKMLRALGINGNLVGAAIIFDIIMLFNEVGSDISVKQIEAIQKKASEDVTYQQQQQ